MEEGGVSQQWWGLLRRSIRSFPFCTPFLALNHRHFFLPLLLLFWTLPTLPCHFLPPCATHAQPDPFPLVLLPRTRTLRWSLSSVLLFTRNPPRPFSNPHTLNSCNPSLSSRFTCSLRKPNFIAHTLSPPNNQPLPFIRTHTPHCSPSSSLSEHAAIQTNVVSCSRKATGVRGQGEDLRAPETPPAWTSVGQTQLGASRTTIAAYLHRSKSDDSSRTCPSPSCVSKRGKGTDSVGVCGLGLGGATPALGGTTNNLQPSTFQTTSLLDQPQTQVSSGSG